MNLIAAMAALAVVLAGCAATPPPATDDSQAGFDDIGPGSTTSTTAAAGPKDPAGAPSQGATETTTLSGRVHDPSNLSIIGARLDVLGTETRGVSGTNGTFSFAGVAPGKITVRVESGGFVTREIDATLKAGKQTELDVELRADPAFAPGLTAHIHDYWGAKTSRLVMDEVVPIDAPGSGGRFDLAAAPQPASSAAANPSVTLVARTNQAQPWEFFLPDSPDNLPSAIWPGTAEVRFTATWGTEPENRMPRVGFAVQDASSESAANVQKAAIGQRLPTVTRGGSVSYFVNASNQTDNGHAAFTSWRFWVWIDNDIAKAPNWEPVLAQGGIRVKIEIFKGQIVLDPAHQDWWGGQDTLVVGDPKADYRPGIATPQDAECMTPQCLLTLRVAKDSVPVVPPGTQKLMIRFSWRLDQPAPTTYTFTYRAADQNPRDTGLADLRVPKLIDSGTGSASGWGLYEIVLDSDDADPFYKKTSTWAFKWIEKNASGQAPYYLAPNFVHFGFEITAVKHPDY